MNWPKTIGAALVVVVALPLLFVAWLIATASFAHPETPYPEITASTDASVIARGEYIARAVAHCTSCHSHGAVVAAYKGYDPKGPPIGGYAIEAGPFGTFYASNLTPAGIGARSDKELARVIRHGVLADGTLAPMMSVGVGPMADQDLTAVVSWLRAQPSVDRNVPPDELGPLAKVLSSKLGPRMKQPPPFVPQGGISAERGRYLADGPAACRSCHTPTDPLEGFAEAGPAYSGVTEADPDPTDERMEFVVPNLTPDRETGHITSWREDQFVKRMLAGRAFSGTKMPWESFALMTEEDLRSIYRYLRSLPPTKNGVGPARRPRD